MEAPFADRGRKRGGAESRATVGVAGTMYLPYGPRGEVPHGLSGWGVAISCTSGDPLRSASDRHRRSVGPLPPSRLVDPRPAASAPSLRLRGRRDLVVYEACELSPSARSSSYRSAACIKPVFHARR